MRDASRYLEAGCDFPTTKELCDKNDNRVGCITFDDYDDHDEPVFHEVFIGKLNIFDPGPIVEDEKNDVDEDDRQR